MMETDIQDIYIQKCIADIEALLKWGNSNEWSTRDFEALSDKILAKTNVQLSVVTLKRVWGKIRYESKPTITTLNALVQFAGHENWRTYKQTQIVLQAKETTRDPDLSAIPTPIQSRRGRTQWVVALVLLGAVCAIVYFTAFKVSPPPPDPTKFTFGSKTIVESGVPNTVVFDYDASAADSDDSVVIQQSWDPRLSTLVESDQHQHTSIYYHPGFFDARLKVNGKIVKSHNLFIKSNGWLPLIDTKPVPVYFHTSDVFQDGYLALPLDKIEATGVPLQPEVPWTGYYNVGEFGEILSNDFIFETELKNDFEEGAAACQHTELHVLFEGAAMVLPLSVPGCVSELDFGPISGKDKDLSRLGVDFSKWVKVKFTVQDTLAQIIINDKNAFDLTATMKPVRWIGMIFRFKGTGSVNYVRVSRKNGDVLYEENFNLSSH